MNEAKEIFLKYRGSFYQMLRDEVYDKYKSYHLPEEVENEWFEEMLANLEKQIESEKNKKKLTRYLGHYLFTAGCAKKREALQYTVMLLERKEPYLDTNSLFSWISMILNAQSLEDDLSLRQELVKKMLALLKEIQTKPITISEDYKENGKYPDYLTEEILLKKIDNKIAYWEKICLN